MNTGIPDHDLGHPHALFLGSAFAVGVGVAGFPSPASAAT